MSTLWQMLVNIPKFEKQSPEFVRYAIIRVILIMFSYFYIDVGLPQHAVSTNELCSAM